MNARPRFAIRDCAHIIERCLNHVLPGIMPVYQRQEYVEERKAASNELGALFEGIIKSAATAPTYDVRSLSPTYGKERTKTALLAGKSEDMVPRASIGLPE
jgi:hypothetical protein